MFLTGNQGIDMVTFGRRKKLKSADLIGGNEDLINQILLCLPARSLVRFKSVSKQWNSLISDPGFCLNHTLKNPSSLIPSGLFFYYKEFDNKKHVTVHSVSLSKSGGKIPDFSHPFDGSMSGIVQSCNGLTLFRIQRSYCVRNLATNQLEFVPLPKLYPHTLGSAWFLAFDPSVSSHYKILCIQEVKYRTHQFLIFSSETGQWKDTNVTTSEYHFPHASDKRVYFQGAIHCLVHRYHRRKACYRFDVEAEKLTIISLPYYGSSSVIRYFGEFSGHLHLVYVRDQSAKRFRVLELDHVRKEWVPKYHVQINRLISQFPEVVEKVTDNKCEYQFSILSVVRGEKEENSALVMAIPGKVVSYNFKSKKFEVLSELPLQIIELDFVYQEDLVYVRDQYAKSFNVLELDHVSQKWFVKCRVQINSLISKFPEVVEKVTTEKSKYAFSILSVARREKEENSAVVMAIPGKVVSYNLKSKKFEVLSELPLQEIELDFLHHTFVFPFFPTLYPLQG
ncbi:F-box domain-containing protein [Heracleum sosnowskyi]|uniref:F-box domain-containing protein n=1 Tax=Heracleum sosnowskyi TaxID=360622 RepID=A0AAD8MXH6_9APIA|nr:F-box domain-containing protein [Heracleum sosnowskyi]